MSTEPEMSPPPLPTGMQALVCLIGPLLLWSGSWMLWPYLPEILKSILMLLSIAALLPFLAVIWAWFGEFIEGCFGLGCALVIGFFALVFFIWLVKQIWYAV